MKKQVKIELDFEVDKITNSIENVISGDRFATDISLITKADLKLVTKKINGSLIGNQNLNNHNVTFIN